MDGNIPAERIKAFVEYHPLTGEMYWKDVNPSIMKSDHAYAVYRGQSVGRRAMNIDAGKGYLVGSLDSKRLMAHRVAWCLFYGDWPEDQIDHIDGNRANNVISNLRSACNGRNGHNRGMLRNNSSGYKGVSWSRAGRGSWRYAIRYSGNRIEHSGFKTALDAALAYDKKALELHGEFAKTNKMMGLL